MLSILEITRLNPVIPVVVVDEVSVSIPLSEALISGGINTVEVTLRTPAAQSVIEKIAANTQILVGAGTVTTLQQAREAKEAGAAYVVMPGYDQNIVSYCQENNLPVLPGATDATLLMKACSAGLKAVKFFPAQALGGLEMINALSGPFPQIKFVPTGGISLNNLSQYLQHGQVAACGGTWIAARELINEKAFNEITDRAKQAVAIAKRSRED